jgi:hypothetical protein
LKTLLAVLFLSALTFAQAPTQTFNFNLSPVSLPGNHQTVVGTEGGMDIAVTPNNSVGEFTIIAPGQNFQFFGGSYTHTFPTVAKFLNDISPNLNFLKFKFGARASVGMSRITLPEAQQHWGETVGGFVDYSLDKGAHYSIGVEVNYVKFPGLTNNNFTVALDPAVHF